MKVLLVGGTFSEDGGKRSSLIDKIAESVQKNFSVDDIVRVYNGGDLTDLTSCLSRVKTYDVVFWWANVSNELPKNRNIKEINPKTILVSSKRNDNEKYSFQELIQRSLELKANLTVEFSKIDGIFKLMVFDPLGVVWYDGFDIDEMCKSMVDRLKFLVNVTRQGTVQIDEKPEVPNNEDFFSYVKDCAEIFHKKIHPGDHVQRFLGNSSFRCQRGFPSFRTDNYIFVSRRNVDKRFIDKDNFVATKLVDGKVYYCGENKPSVDTPVQLRLYEKLPNINFMVHSHCYAEDALTTKTPVPCGAIEEVDEILNVIGDFNKDFYVVNLIGHGCIVMSSDVEKMRKVRFTERNVPEVLN